MKNQVKTIEECGAVTENLHLIGEHVAGRDIHITVHSRQVVVFDVLQPWVDGVGWLLGRLTPLAGGLMIATSLIVLAFLDFEQVNGPWLMRLAMATFPLGLLLMWKPKNWRWPLLFSLVSCLLLWEINPLTFFGNSSAMPVSPKEFASAGFANIEPSEELINEAVSLRVKSWQRRVAATLPFEAAHVCSADSMRYYLEHCGLPENGQPPNYYFNNNQEILRSPFNLQRLGLRLQPSSYLESSLVDENHYFQREETQVKSGHKWTFGVFRPGTVEHSLRESHSTGVRTWEVEIEYANPERLLTYQLQFPKSGKVGVLTSVRILGFKPREIYQFSQSDGTWKYTGIK